MARYATVHQKLGEIKAGDQTFVRLEHDFSAAITLVAEVMATVPTGWVEPEALGHRHVIEWSLYDAIDPDGPQWTVPDTSGGHRHRFSSETATSSRRRFVVPFGPTLFVGLQVVLQVGNRPHPTAVVPETSITVFVRTLA